MTLSCLLEDGACIARSIARGRRRLWLVVATPECALETSLARPVLPDVAAGGRRLQPAAGAALRARAQTGDYDDLREAMRDRWHQPARAPLVPGLAEALALDHPAVLGACLSGAGPSVARLVTGGAATRGGRVLERRLSTARRGAYDQNCSPPHRAATIEETHEFQPPLSSVPDGFPGRRALGLRQCLGPLEVTYDYDAIRRVVSRESIESRPKNLWRYRELLPIDGEPRTGLHSGFTPLVRADRLAARLGVARALRQGRFGQPSDLLYKDRVVSVAATRAVELGFTVFACASTGNLADSVASHAARLGLACSSSFPTISRPARSPAPASTAAHRRRARQL